MISAAEKIAQCAEHIANDDSHGYSQPNRKGWGSEGLKFSDGSLYSVHRGDYDCSEMARQCAEAAGLLAPDSYMWTGNEDSVLTGAGFSRLPYSTNNLVRGDILWKPGHTGIYLGGGMMADAHGDEWGGIDGPTEGDQTGREIEIRPVTSCSWQTTYRPPSSHEEADISRGIDVSNWQGDGGADAIRDTACGFVIVKASEGTGFKDWYAKANADAADGKLLGFYHYANNGSAEDEAAWFVKCCEETGHLEGATLWLDYEGEAVNNGPEWAERFMQEVDRLTGKTCGFYSYKSCINAQDFTASCWRPLWGAQYASSSPVYGWKDDPWQSSEPWGAWGKSIEIFQYTGKGHVDGYDGPLDLDRGYFTELDWAAWANGTASPKEDTDEGDPMTPTMFEFAYTTNVRTAPNLGSEVVATYEAGESVVVDSLAYSDGIVWGGYTGASGNRRYVAIGHTDRVVQE